MKIKSGCEPLRGYTSTRVYKNFELGHELKRSQIDFSPLKGAKKSVNSKIIFLNSSKEVFGTPTDRPL